MATLDELTAQLDKLALFDPGPFPVISLYLNAQPNEHGRDNFEPFLRKELAERIRTYGAGGPERSSLDADAERIHDYVTSIDAAANGVAIFACSAADLFEVIEVAMPIDEHRLYISDQPHLYPLAKLAGALPKYAVVVADTQSARILVVAGNEVKRSEQVAGTPTRRHKMGGWSQARYQRHIDNYHEQHAKEVVEVLSRIVRDESIEAILLAGDEVIVPMLKEQMSQELTERLVDVLKLDVRAPERDVLEATLDAMKENDSATDRERVQALLDAYRSNGLGVVGAEATARALEMGQVDELMITGAADVIDPGSVGGAVDETRKAERSAEERAADELIAKASQTAAKIRIIEDGSLLAAVGGVGAFLRFKM
jgi:peptide subunit release factor 1 (eRF1)